MTDQFCDVDFNSLYCYKQNEVVERKGTFKLETLRKIEVEVQQKWNEAKIFEEDAPEPNSPDRK